MAPTTPHTTPATILGVLEECETWVPDAAEFVGGGEELEEVSEDDVWELGEEVEDWLPVLEEVCDVLPVLGSDRSESSMLYTTGVSMSHV